MNLTSFENQFKYCGKITRSLIEDILSLNIPENFLFNCCCLPTAIGYNKESNIFFARRKEDRSNNFVDLFKSNSEKEFRFYILELFAKSWGREYEKNKRQELELNWKYVHDKVIDGKWQYKLNESANYEAIYDGRKHIFDTTISHLLNKYKINELEPYIKRLENLLNNNTENSPKPYIIWEYSKKEQEFVVKKVIK